jgi:hypothetical protein
MYAIVSTAAKVDKKRSATFFKMSSRWRSWSGWKNDLYSKTEEGTESFQPGRMALLANVVIDACGGLLYSFVRIYLRRICSEM